MKPNIWYKHFMFIILALFINCILSGCGTGTSSSGGGGNNTPVSLGVLSNGSTLYTSISSFPVNNTGTTASGMLSLVGGTPNASFTINFGTSVLQGTQKSHTSSKRLQGTDANGINITPSSCVMGTAGSGNPSECAYTIGAASSTPPGTYAVPVSATDSNGVVQNLGSITVLVSGTVSPSSHEITSYSLNGTAGVITDTNIAVTMPYGTNVTALVATFTTTGETVAVGGTNQTSGSTPNNFISPVVYTVTAADGSTQNYTVIVTILPQAWNDVGTPGLSTGAVLYTSIAFNPSTNQPYVVYQDDGNGSKATVMTFNGTTWVNVGFAGFSAGLASYTSIAFNPSTNQPYVVYRDGANNEKATVMTFNGTAWVNVGSAGFSTGAVLYTSIAFNPSTSQPYVVYRDSGNGSRATVMMFNGTAWVNVGVPGFSAGQAQYTSIAFNPSTNQPYVVYGDGANGDKATAMMFNGTAWASVGVPGFSTGSALFTSIAFNPSTNQPYVVYRDGANNGKATVMMFGVGSTGAPSWIDVGEPGFSAGTTNFTSIAFNPSTSEPYVVYRDNSENGNKATVMRFPN